jgi:hypothetical protein
MRWSGNDSSLVTKTRPAPSSSFRICARVLRAILHERNAAVRPQRGSQLRESAVRVGELVVDVHHQDQIDAPYGKLRVVGARQHGHDVGGSRLGYAPPKQREHLGLKLGRQHFPCRSHAAGESKAEVAGSGAHVRDDAPLRNVEHVEDMLWLFTHVAVGAVEPVRAAVAHRTSQCPPQVGTRRFGHSRGRRVPPRA